jgi:RNA polymerase sigma factor (sigma-70 family)
LQLLARRRWRPDDGRVEDDAELFDRWTAGDDVAGQVLFRRHFQAIARFFRNKATDDWQELVQRTFLACVESRPGFRREGSFRSFLFGIAYRQLLRHYEGRGHERIDVTQRSAHDLDPTASACMAKHEQERRLLAALRRIPLEYQAILELHYWEELTVESCAEALELPLGTAKTRLRRARELLERELAALEQGPAIEATATRLEEWAASLRKQLTTGR